MLPLGAVSCIRSQYLLVVTNAIHQLVGRSVFANLQMGPPKTFQKQLVRAVFAINTNAFGYFHQVRRGKKSWSSEVRMHVRTELTLKIDVNLPPYTFNFILNHTLQTSL